ncbi:YcnI family protein [Streptomyces sp. NPDC127084]|uniref:YcnI family copper-binding membrane protein n=1 Tax=Streptomyces sp. NPDC127084 TaxID=3347133 RepID=UPI00365F05F1
MSFTVNTFSRLTIAAGITASSVLLLSVPAFAHVSVQPQGEAAKGGYATVIFKVPNESDTASTVKLEVSLPTEHPLSSVMPQPVPGWKAVTTKTELAKPLTVHGKQITKAVTKITWTADGGRIAPGEFQQFPVSLGKLPEDTDSLVFKALQTYDDKQVVRWIEEPKQGAAEPENPAPVLALSAATGDHHGGAAASDDKNAKGGHEGGEHGEGGSETAADSADSDTTARVLAVLGIALGVAGVAFGVLAGRRRAS